MPKPSPLTLSVCSVAGAVGGMELFHHLFLPGSGTPVSGKLRQCLDLDREPSGSLRGSWKT